MAGSRRPNIEPRMRVVGYTRSRIDSAYVGRYGESFDVAIGYDSVAVLVDGIGVSDELEPGGVGSAVELPLVLDVERESVDLPCRRVDRRGVTSAIARVIT